MHLLLEFFEWKVIAWASSVFAVLAGLGDDLSGTELLSCWGWNSTGSRLVLRDPGVSGQGHRMLCPPPSTCFICLEIGISDRREARRIHSWWTLPPVSGALVCHRVIAVDSLVVSLLPDVVNLNAPASKASWPHFVLQRTPLCRQLLKTWLSVSAHHWRVPSVTAGERKCARFSHCMLWLAEQVFRVPGASPGLWEGPLHRVGFCWGLEQRSAQTRWWTLHWGPAQRSTLPKTTTRFSAGELWQPLSATQWWVQLRSILGLLLAFPGSRGYPVSVHVQCWSEQLCQGDWVTLTVVFLWFLGTFSSHHVLTTGCMWPWLSVYLSFRPCFQKIGRRSSVVPPPLHDLLCDSV